MTWTQKEKNFLKDLQSEEKLCAEKYHKAAEAACDGTLKQILQKIEKAEQGHCDTVTGMLAGTMPAPQSQGKAQAGRARSAKSLKAKTTRAQKQSDAYLLVALSGALLCQFNGFAEINMGRGAIVIALAAIIIGDVAFGRIFRNFGLTLLAVSFGSIIYYVVIQFVISELKLNTNYMKLISALIVALFLAVPYWKRQHHHGKGKVRG